MRRRSGRKGEKDDEGRKVREEEKNNSRAQCGIYKSKLEILQSDVEKQIGLKNEAVVAKDGFQT